MENMKSLVVGIIVIIIIILGGIFFFHQNLTSKFFAPQTQSTQNTPGTQVISLSSNGFSPSQLVIKPSITVEWINNSKNNAGIQSQNNAYPPMNFNSISPGSLVEVTFTVPGTYQYYNAVNTSQKGTIVVKE